MADVQVIVTETDSGDVDKLEYQQPAYVAVALIMAMSAFFVFFPMIITSGILGFDHNIYGTQPSAEPCYDSCRFVHSIEFVVVFLQLSDLNFKCTIPITRGRVNFSKQFGEICPG